MGSLLVTAWALLAAAGAGAAAPPGPRADHPEPATVGKALADARYFLIRQLHEQTGRSRHEYDEDGWRYGIQTALVAWALTAAGEDHARNPVLQHAYEWLMARPRKGTEFVSLRALAIAALPKKDAELFQCLASDAKWLIAAPSEEGYFGPESLCGQSGRGFDSICADWAVMALAAAAANDVLVPQAFWKGQVGAWVRTQLPDGRWDDFARGPLDPGRSASFTATAAGLCVLKICQDRLEPDALSEYESRCLADACRRGTAWLDERFCLRQPRRKGDVSYATYRFPGDGLDAFHPGGELRWHWLLNVARLRVLTGRSRWGGVEPCAALAGEILAGQNDDGSWGGGWEAGGIWRIQLTAFAALFLSSHVPAAGAPPSAGG